jgi:hypothetical protein
MFAAADVYASEEALESIFPHLNEKLVLRRSERSF